MTGNIGTSPSLFSVATWNVNSVRARLDNVVAWLNENRPDVVCLQEIKATDETFPFFEIESCGYHATIVGQKSYNGVAVLTRDAAPDAVIRRHLPFFGDEKYEPAAEPQARYVEIDYRGHRVASIYLPNGNPVDTDKFPYKLEWLQRLRTHIETSLLNRNKPVILCGDFNVIPRDEDCYSPEDWKRDALFRPETAAAWRAIKNTGFYDAFESLHPYADKPYTFWDYQAGARQKNLGIRIDHFLVNPIAADRLKDCVIHSPIRDTEKASDHVPVVLTMKSR